MKISIVIKTQQLKKYSIKIGLVMSLRSKIFLFIFISIFQSNIKSHVWFKILNGSDNLTKLNFKKTVQIFIYLKKKFWVYKMDFGTKLMQHKFQFSP